MGHNERVAQIIFLYLLVLVGGLFTIYLFQCEQNMYLIDDAKAVAEELAEKGQISDYERYLPGSILLYKGDEIETLHQYYRQKDVNFSQYLKGLEEFYQNREDVYMVPGSLSPLACTAVAGQPVIQADGKYLGELYVCYCIKSLPVICICYALLCTVIYCVLVAAFVRIIVSHKEIESIYRQYIANISHELKTPIASIQAIGDTLSEGLAKDETTQSRYYGIISREARQLEHSVLQIIELSKLQDRRIQYEKTRVTLHELLDPVAERYSSRCEEIGIHFSVSDEVWKLPDLKTDGYRLTQLLEILLDNAYKFVDEDGHIFIDATYIYGQVTLRVNDDGRGISEADMPYIFDRFFKTAVNNPTGSGLGLAIAREIANGLKEKLWVQSEEGEGTIFFMTVSTME